MASRAVENVFFAFLLSEEEAANNRAQATLHHLRQFEDNVRFLKTSRPQQVDTTAHKYEHKAVVKREPTAAKRRRKGGRCAEDYLQKGGMMAFYNLSDFNTHFGMTRTQVEGLLNELQPHYPYERGSKLPLENVVLASLRVLSSQESYGMIAERFQTSKSVICTSLHTFCSLVSGNLENHIRWPIGNAIRGTMQGFEDVGFPGTLGAMDAFHIPINKPKDVQEPDEYMKENTMYCTTLLAVCDNKYKFTYVNVGHPGAFDDSDVFKRCELHKAFQEDPDSLLPYDFHIGGKVYPFHIIADAGFPLSEYVMTPYVDDGHLKHKEIEYNRHHSSALLTVSKAVGVLKARYNRLKLLQMQHLAQCSIAIKACCILHNICVQNSDAETFGVDEVPPLITTPHVHFESNVAGESKRSIIADSLLE
ncbi:protein ALP1-like isoform X1 [Portunus trituberculatus]|uniref:protein ALP1-like isoform X1 n=1 Tax=Portunus trituberculatus TaxID=210409 RepID=UPI001E1CBE47|nr:protein ALP1-like isoform X1 [Portunus trituberculatus]